MKKLQFLMMALLFAVLSVGCSPEPVVILPPNPNPEQGEDTDDEKDDDDDNNEGGGTTDLPFISTDPAFVTEAMTEDVIVILNAKGTTADGFKGELYAHTGVLTSKSTGSSDWKYVKAEWTQNIPDCKLENKGNNIWHLVIKGGPRAYYGVPEGEAIEKLAFVFRAADGSLEVKDNGQDIFIDVVAEGLSVAIVNPASGSILQVGDTCDVTVNQKSATSLTLYKNDEVVAESSDAQIVYKYAPTQPEDVVFRAVATDGATTVEDSINVAVLGETESASRPGDARDGVTVSGTSATFVLYAPGKKSVILLGDFNNYAPSNEYMMKRDGDYFWTTVEGLQSGVEYGYQYLVDGAVKVGDPYATKILDPWNDKWIDASVYPNLKAYPAEYTTDIVSVFELNPVEYAWSVTDFDRPAENSLAVYELLLRDFTLDSSVDAALAKLDYLDKLGINAIELMPIQEFDGNDSWGYNPCFYFAADKAYGTEEAYKRFIDECHKRGIAVILDVVFNHATGQFPWAKMWWDSSKNCTAADNPFFNVSAPHNFSVYHDFKHLYPKTRQYFKEVLQYWLTEYKVDGFRFDLTKGLVQNPSNYDAWGYSSERIEILTDYARAIREVAPDAYVIFEHFCDQAEENELYNSVGALCWNNNAMGGYMESVMGWTGGGKSNFADFKSGRMNNIETHDEERIGYKAITYGQTWMKSDWSIISKRIQAVYAFHFLTPYPKMLWQFGELGYDFSINANENGVVGSGDEYRTHRKPVRWDYANDADRMAIYNTLSKVLNFRAERDDIYAQDNVKIHTWSVSDNNMGGKTLVMDNVIMVANFTNAETSTTVNVPQGGTWRNLLTDEQVSLSGSYTATLAAHDFVILVR